MKNKMISAGLLAISACLLFTTPAKADAYTAYQLMLLSAAATPYRFP